MRHYLPFSDQQSRELECAQALLPASWRSLFLRSVENRLGADDRTDGAITAAINSVLAAYGVSAPINKETKNARTDKRRRPRPDAGR